MKNNLIKTIDIAKNRVSKAFNTNDKEIFKDEVLSNKKEIYDFIFNKIIEEFKIHDGNETHGIYFNNQESIKLVLNELKAKYL